MECVQLESKCRAEMDEHRQKIDREFDALLAGHGRELDALSQRHGKERERQQKMAAAVEARRRRHMQQQQETELKQFLAQQKKDYVRWKEELRRVECFVASCVSHHSAQPCLPTPDIGHVLLVL